MNETELREILDSESDPPPHGVTVDGVRRRVRSIRLRRARLAGGVVLAGALAFNLPTLGGSTQDAWTTLAGGPSPASSAIVGSPSPVVSVFRPGRELSRHSFGTAGRKQRFTYDAKGEPVGLTIDCPGLRGHFILWADGRPVAQGACGVVPGSWWDRRGEPRTGPVTYDLLVIPAGLAVRPPTPDQVAGLAATARPFPARVEVTVRANDFVRCTGPAIVIVDPATGRRVHSTDCQAGSPSPAPGE
ncbi:hypothetical protein Misp01_25090 [Microtetraspora sp. NBRC 13810]|uniref:hypothetical protein n=1 Tax=Microtetraspora sp. NBRC 13810 TaxID=3030990 RepID=UPI0024A362EE|nr:hypothetical protein [Microtetraspora sp. NBRC 13810]GLW07379.1 hypothetical protein Misp01_25090 [Microtetraspora sp. NBRC 13810]